MRATPVLLAHMTIEQRLQHLESSNRFMKIALAVCHAVRLEFKLPSQDMASDFITVENIAPALGKLQ
jgi:hypothetical protein